MTAQLAINFAPVLKPGTNRAAFFRWLCESWRGPHTDPFGRETRDGLYPANVLAHFGGFRFGDHLWQLAQMGLIRYTVRELQHPVTGKQVGTRMYSLSILDTGRQEYERLRTTKKEA